MCVDRLRKLAQSAQGQSSGFTELAFKAALWSVTPQTAGAAVQPQHAVRPRGLGDVGAGPSSRLGLRQVQMGTAALLAGPDWSSHHAVAAQGLHVGLLDG